MKEYVAAFVFYEGMVALIKKAKPEWQKGLLNGIGGKIEPGELVAHAMSREFREETGLEIAPGEFKHFCTLDGRDKDDQPWRVFFFTYELIAWTAMRDEGVGEEVHWVDYTRMITCPLTAIPNLSWLIPMALGVSKHDWPYHVRERS